MVLMKFSFTLILQLVAWVVAVAAGTVFRGWPGIWGAVVAMILVLLFFGSTKVIIGPIATMSPAMSQPLALLFFLTKAAVLAALLIVMWESESAADFVDFVTLGVTLIVGSVVWIIGQTIDHSQARILTFDLPESDDSPTDTMTE